MSLTARQTTGDVLTPDFLRPKKTHGAWPAPNAKFFSLSVSLGAQPSLTMFMVRLQGSKRTQVKSLRTALTEFTLVHFEDEPSVTTLSKHISKPLPTAHAVIHIQQSESKRVKGVKLRRAVLRWQLCYLSVLNLSPLLAHSLALHGVSRICIAQQVLCAGLSSSVGSSILVLFFGRLLHTFPGASINSSLLDEAKRTHFNVFSFVNVLTSITRTSKRRTERRRGPRGARPDDIDWTAHHNFQQTSSAQATWIISIGPSRLDPGQTPPPAADRKLYQKGNQTT